MGSRLSLGYEQRNEPEVFPSVPYPPTFDPLTGFPQGRKPREMKATVEEMDAYRLVPEERDYCAHTFIEWKKCISQKIPFGGHHCSELIHTHNHCVLEDSIMRMKEFERERRLLKRMKRKRLAVEQEAAPSE